MVIIWASLDGGPVCILATEFNFAEQLAEFLGEGAARSVGQFHEMGGQSLGDLLRVQLSAVSDILQGVLQGFLGALWAMVSCGLIAEGAAFL